MKIRGGISAEQARREIKRAWLGRIDLKPPRQSKAELKTMLEQAARNTVSNQRRSA